MKTGKKSKEQPLAAFEGRRLRDMRWRRGLTKKGLADLAGIDQRAVSRFEDGTASPTPGQADVLARALDVPPAYLSREWDADIREEDLSFRAPTKMTVRAKHAAMSLAHEGIEMRGWISERYECPRPSIPDYSCYAGRPDGPEQAAEMVREEWGLGNQPIANMVTLLEAHGAAVFSARTSMGMEFDAFSLTYDGIPYVFLQNDKTPERGRFDAAHELGHLVLHAAEETRDRRILEQEANRFASAFLMPRSDVYACCPRNASVESIKRMKRRWGVAATALCMRLHQLDMTTDWVKHSNMVILAQEGFRSGEPGSELAREKSHVLGEVIKDLARRHGLSDMTSGLDQNAPDLSMLMFDMPMTAHGHGDTPTGRPRRTTGQIHQRMRELGLTLAGTATRA